MKLKIDLTATNFVLKAYARDGDEESHTLVYEFGGVVTATKQGAVMTPYSTSPRPFFKPGGDLPADELLTACAVFGLAPDDVEVTDALRLNGGGLARIIFATKA